MSRGGRRRDAMAEHSQPPLCVVRMRAPPLSCLCALTEIFRLCKKALTKFFGEASSEFCVCGLAVRFVVGKSVSAARRFFDHEVHPLSLSTVLRDSCR
eukprot:SAG25_NODE_293_length_10288_cov_2.565904_13_plen_98_part_00